MVTMYNSLQFASPTSMVWPVWWSDAASSPTRKKRGDFVCIRECALEPVILCLLTNHLTILG